MADPLDYTLVRIDDNIEDKAVLTYDAVNDKLTDSGLKASLGELKAAAGTVGVGLQEMSSAGAQVVWRNVDSQVCYAPPWHVIDELNEGGSYDRYYGPVQSETRYAIRTDVLENPKFEVYVPNAEVVFKLNMTFVSSHENVQFKVTHGGFEMWSEVKNVSAGEQDILLGVPIAFPSGTYEFSIEPYGDPNLAPPVKVMGDGQTGKVGYTVVHRSYEEKKLATEEYVQSHGGTGSGDMTKAVYDPNDDGVVNSADVSGKVSGVDAAPSSTYYGKDSSGNVGFHKLPDGADEVAINAELQKHETSIEAHGVQIAANTQNISTNKNNVDLALKTSKNTSLEVDQLRKIVVDGISADVNNANKTILIKLVNPRGTADSVLIDLSSWFSGSSPQPSSHTIYYGFSGSPTVSEDNVKTLGQTQEVSGLSGLELTLTRQNNTPAYMFAWLPDSLGSINGFTFGGFTSVWQSTALSVNGVMGKLFISPNKTASTSVTFEVKQ